MTKGKKHVLTSSLLLSAIDVASSLEQYMTGYVADRPKMKRVEVELDTEMVAFLDAYAKKASDAIGLSLTLEDIASCVLSQYVEEIILQEDLAKKAIKKTCSRLIDEHEKESKKKTKKRAK